jgi:bifunctional DNA-binding transcriptional regulator/antitoxin component of YhaV-PrlF toxin-antitoxin module
MNKMSDETVRETATIQPDGRTTIPDAIRKAVNIYEQKAFCQVENYGKDKILLTILSRWTPTKRGPGKDVVKK